MTRDEFFEEAVNSDVKIKELPAIMNEFRKYQDDTMRTLREFHRICEKSGVRYQLAFGSLLGAVRDGGQIPWDYDIDVIVPFDDRLKLIEALKNNISEEYYYYSPEKDSKCRHYFIRLAPREYSTKKLHVDVFYVIGSPNDNEERIAFSRMMKKWFNYRFYKLAELKDFGVRMQIKLILYKIKLMPLCLNKINERMMDICASYSMDRTDKCIPVFSVYDNIVFDTNRLWDTILIDNDYGTFRITRNYDEILSGIYGEYMKIYPLENRLREMITCYEAISEKNVIWERKKIKQSRYYIE